MRTHRSLNIAAGTTSCCEKFSENCKFADTQLQLYCGFSLFISTERFAADEFELGGCWEVADSKARWVEGFVLVH